MHPLHELDKKLLKYLNYEKGFFIECGANDGVSQSNTFLLEQELNWSGLLVEPGFENFQKCKALRNKCIVENYALVSSEYTESTIEGNFNNPSHNGLMNSINGYPSYFNEEMIFWANKFRQENTSFPTKVQCATLQYLLDKHGVSKVDFFSLDVEGYEIEVLKGLDFTKIRPTYILIETTTHEYYREIVTNYMLSKNYKKIEEISINDILYRDN
jgi:FkbM family methyltransferase